MKNGYPCGLQYYIERLGQEIPSALKDIFKENVDSCNITEELRNYYNQRDSEFSEDFFVDKQMKRDFNLKGVYDKRINYFISPNSRNDNRDSLCVLVRNHNSPKANSECFSFVSLIDLVAFKPFNDYLGYDAGDVILAFFCDLLTKELEKENHMLVRKGGEEFLAYYINKAKCRKKYPEWEALENGSTDKTEQIIAKFYDSTIEKLSTKIACLFVPKDGEGGKRKLWYDGAFADNPFFLSENDGDLDEQRKQHWDKNFITHHPNFRFRFLIRGLEFRFGVGSEKNGTTTAAESAENDMEWRREKSSQTKISPRRGDFGDSVKFGFIDGDVNCSSMDELDPLIKWCKPNKHIFLFVDDLELANKIKDDVFYSHSPKVYVDNSYNAFCIAIEFNGYKLKKREDNDVGKIMDRLDGYIKDIKKVIGNKAIKNEDTETEVDECEFMRLLKRELGRLNDSDPQIAEDKDKGWLGILMDAAIIVMDKNDSANRSFELNKHITTAINKLSANKFDDGDLIRKEITELSKIRKFDSRAAFLRSTAFTLKNCLGDEDCKRITLLSGKSVYDKYILKKGNVST